MYRWLVIEVRNNRAEFVEVVSDEDRAIEIAASLAFRLGYSNKDQVRSALWDSRSFDCGEFTMNLIPVQIWK